MSDSIFSIEPLKLEACLIAVVCGFIIGLERQWRGKPAGIRTSILVCMGAYTFVTLANLYQPGEGSVRVLGQVVTGVGFLGAGLILSNGGLVQGVTSAAIIWILAAIGSLIGFHNYGSAILLTLVTISVLYVITLLEKTFKKLKRGVHKDKEEELLL